MSFEDLIGLDCKRIFYKFVKYCFTTCKSFYFIKYKLFFIKYKLFINHQRSLLLFQTEDMTFVKEFFTNLIKHSFFVNFFLLFL